MSDFGPVDIPRSDEDTLAGQYRRKVTLEVSNMLARFSRMYPDRKPALTTSWGEGLNKLTVTVRDGGPL